MLIHYTLGFVFTTPLDQVLLIRKRKPAWQCGLLNGVGGKKMQSESGRQCISRELIEESGIDIQPDNWISCGSLKSPAWVVKVFCIQIAYRSIFKDTAEGRCEWHKVTTLPINVVPNLRFLIPLCMLRLQDKSIKYFNLNYV